MERKLWGAVIGSLLGLSSIGAIGFVGSTTCACGGPPAPLPRVEGDWRLLDPVTYENITIFPVVSSSNRDTSYFLTLEDGLSSGEVIVREQGSEGLARSRDNRPIPPSYSSGASVNQLVLINRSKRPLLLLAGELVSGGKQDRIIAKDRIIAPGADPLHPSVREQAAVNLDQNQVWDAVRSGSKSKQASSPSAYGAAAAAPMISAETVQVEIESGAPTQSYAKIYKESRIGGSVDTFVYEVQRRFAKATRGLKGEQVVGVVVAYGGDVAWSDIFASGELFDHYWSKLLRSYAVEAMARPTFRETADRDDAREFLRRLNGRERQESEPGVYLWREISEGHLSQIELDALQPKPMTLHRLVIHRTS